MTSLPDEPIYESFDLLKEIDRDTILSENYAAPDDFNVPIKDLLKNPQAAFTNVNLDKLNPHPEIPKMNYVKETFTKYSGTGPFEDTAKQTQERGAFFRRRVYRVEHDKIFLTQEFFDQDKKLLGKTTSDCLLKRGMTKTDLPAKSKK